jgi:hypothetical protein
MHKGIIILTKASDRDEAKSNVEEFLEGFGNGDVWDWYSIGGRWNNLLAPKDIVKKFTEWVHEKYPVTKGYYSIKDIEETEAKQIIQNKWEELGLRSKNPYWDSYGFSLTDLEDDYNILPLSECVDMVREWCKDSKKEAEEYFEKLVEERAKEKIEGMGTMSAYYAGLYKDAVYDNFCFETNVYDASESVGETIPEDIKEYWAVVIDIHN